MSPDEIILTTLTRHGVPFVVIGGLAVIEHGYVRVTEDTDLVFRRTDAGFLDLFDYIPGFPDQPVDALFADAKVRHGVRFASLPWLRRMKEAGGRPKDLDDLENLVPS